MNIFNILNFYQYRVFKYLSVCYTIYLSLFRIYIFKGWSTANVNFKPKEYMMVGWGSWGRVHVVSNLYFVEER